MLEQRNHEAKPSRAARQELSLLLSVSQVPSHLHSKPAQSVCHVLALALASQWSYHMDKLWSISQAVTFKQRLSGSHESCSFYQRSHWTFTEFMSKIKLSRGKKAQAGVWTCRRRLLQEDSVQEVTWVSSAARRRWRGWAGLWQRLSVWNWFFMCRQTCKAKEKSWWQQIFGLKRSAAAWEH